MVRSYFNSDGERVFFGHGDSEAGPFPNDVLDRAYRICDRWDVLNEINETHEGKQRIQKFEKIVSVSKVLEKNARHYFAAVKMGDEAAAEEFLNNGIPINCAEPSTGFTALHYAASRKAHSVMAILLNKDGIDHLKRDGFGRLASELAGRFGENLELSRRLRMLEAAQAQKQGITLTYRPRPSATED